MFPAKGLTIEPIRVDIAPATSSIGFCGAAAVDTAGRGFVGVLTSGALVAEGTDGADTADVGAEMAAGREALSVLMDAVVSGTADGTEGAMVPADSATRGTTLLEGTASLDLLPGLGNVGAGEVISPGRGRVPPGTVAIGGVFDVAKVVDPPVPTATPGAAEPAIPEEVDAVLDGEPEGPAGVDDADVVPGLDADDFDVDEPDIDELVDDELVEDPDNPDGSPDATADPETTAAPIPNAAASPPIRPTYTAAPIPM